MNLYSCREGPRYKKIIDIKKHSSHRDKDSIKKLLNPFSIIPGIATFSNRKSLKYKNICSNDFFRIYIVLNLLFDICKLLSLIIKNCSPIKSINYFPHLYKDLSFI